MKIMRTQEVTSKMGRNDFSSGGSNGGGSGGSGSCIKRPRQKGHMDHFFTPNSEMVVQNRKNIQTTINNAYKKEAKERAGLLFCRWMYDAAIPFNAVNYASFQPMLETIGQYDVGYKGPSFHDVRFTNLKKELALIKNSMSDHFTEWKQNGCSIMSDGWTDRKERSLVNFLVNSSRGTMFMKSVDASSMVKTGDKLFELLDSWVEEVSEANVVQVITDNASNYVATGTYNLILKYHLLMYVSDYIYYLFIMCLNYVGRMLEKKIPHLYWTPCVAHCLDLILEDIGKLPHIKKTIERAISISGYIYNRTGLLNMMRRFTEQRKLLKPAKTWFATAFIILSCINEQRNNLRKMFTSSVWTESKWANEQKRKNIANIIFISSFWNTVVFCLKVTGPLVHVFRLVDGEKMPHMGYIYAAMKKAKEIIVKSFNGNEEKYREIMEIIDRRWEVQLQRPLHSAGYFLNPRFYYDTKGLGVDLDSKMFEDVCSCMSRLVKNRDKKKAIISQLDLYMHARDLFGNDFAIITRKTKPPG